MKASEIREMTAADLEAKVFELKKQLMDLRFKYGVNQLEDNSQLRKTKKDVARLLTVMNEKKKTASDIKADK
jgi:large subunit ribosomal protein L29